MQPPARPLVPIALGALLALVPFAAVGASTSEIPPLADRELSTFVTIEKALVADSGRAAEICSVHLSSDDEDAPPDPDGANIGRLLEAHPYFGPLLRRHDISGQRFAQVTVQIVASALGLAMADSLDAGAREKGKPATNRATFLERSPDARLVAARLEEITAVLSQYKELCGEGGDEESEDEASDDSGSL